MSFGSLDSLFIIHGNLDSLMHYCFNDDDSRIAILGMMTTDKDSYSYQSKIRSFKEDVPKIDFYLSSINLDKKVSDFVEIKHWGYTMRHTLRAKNSFGAVIKHDYILTMDQSLYDVRDAKQL